MLVLVMHEPSQFWAGPECTVDVVSVVAVAAISCPIVDSYYGAAGFEPG